MRMKSDARKRRRRALRLAGRGLLISLLVVGTCWAEDEQRGVSVQDHSSGDAIEAADEAEPSEQQLAEARMHFENGVTLLEASPPNYQDAYRQFLLAYEKSGHSWKVLGNLGFCALNLERDGEALQYYQQYLDQGGDEVTAEERAAIEKEMLLIQGNMAHVTIQSPLEDVRVSVSREGSNVPAQLYELEDGKAKLGLRAGELHFVAYAGDQEQRWDIVVSPGESKSHTFDFAAPEPDAVLGVKPVGENTEPSSSVTPLRAVGYGVGGVGVAAVVGGVVTGLLSQNQADSAREQCVGNVCPEAVESEFSAASDLALATNVLFVGGGILAATGVTLVIIGGGKKESAEPTASLTVVPSVSSERAGLVAQGSF